MRLFRLNALMNAVRPSSQLSALVGCDTTDADMGDVQEQVVRGLALAARCSATEVK